MLRRGRIVVVVACALLVPIADARACADAPVGAPGRAVAWRAGIERRTPVYDRLASPHPARRIAPSDAPWLLILGPAREIDGRCRLKVRLPWRPNDAAGWIDADQVPIEETPWRIEVSTRARTLSLYRAGTRVRTVRAVVGKPATPTPAGGFAVTWAIRWRPEDFLGSWVLELTAHSTVLQRYDGGDGTVAIHGRGGASLSDPLGSARSHGCVRLANDAISRIVRTVGASRLPGTPVDIR
jgi:lipoprotein-anchoring transpeptidase ErfK/SrfK